MTSHLGATLRELTGREHILPTGRGATAIYLALRAAGVSGQKVVLPGNICPAAVCPVLYSGNSPVFCDANLVDFGVDLADLERVLAEGAAAAIIPHSYGHAAPMDDIANLCSGAGALLIEDAAPALGAQPDGRPAGSHGDASVLSFGSSKIADAGCGGALVSDDAGFTERARELEEELPPWTPMVDQRERDMVQMVRGWWNARRTEPRLDATMKEIWVLYEDVHLWRLPECGEARILDALASLPAVVSQRNANFAAYQATLADSPVTRPEVRSGSVCWRYTFLVDQHIRDQFVDDLRGRGLDVSTLYPCAQSQFGLRSDGELPHCAAIERSAVNLWVAPPLTEPDIQRNAEVVGEVLDELS